MNLRTMQLVAGHLARHPKAATLIEQLRLENLPADVASRPPRDLEPPAEMMGPAAPRAEPEIQPSELEFFATAAAAIESFGERLDSLEIRNAGRAKARAQGYTEDGLKPLEDFMEKNGITDHEAGIRAFERQNPAPPPILTGGSRWNFFEPQGSPQQPDADLAALFEGREEQWLTGQIQRALADVRGR